MSTLAPDATARAASAPARARGRGWDTTGVVAAALLGCLALAVVHLTQGTSGVGASDLLDLALGSGDEEVRRILGGSRLPRMLAAVLVGLALGLAGAALQSVSRNALATPDTLAVNAGAHLTVVAVAALGLSLPVLPLGGAAFAGGLLAAVLVLALSGGATATTRLVLAGSAVALALSSLTMVLLILFEPQTTGLFAWGNGTLSLGDLVAVQQMGPVVLVGGLLLLTRARALDLLGLGDDTATVLGLPVRRTKVVCVLLAVVLSTAAVTVAGPIGFVGLCAPALVRLAGPVLPGVVQHRVLLPLAGLVGVLLVLGADVVLRAAMGADSAARVPTGVVTTMVGALFLVHLARRGRDAGPVRGGAGLPGDGRPRRVPAWAATTAVVALVLAVGLAGMLVGDRMVLLGDLANWVSGRTGTALTFVLDQRLPRVLAALLAGAALAVAGGAVQGVARNPLADPGLLGISAGAGLAAVTVITAAPLAPTWVLTAAAAGGALAAFALVYAAAWRGGLESNRLVLIGIGVSAGLAGLTTLVIVVTDPWSTAKALTWLSGSTYGRTLELVAPVAVALAVVGPLLVLGGRRIDLLALDEDTPRVLGLTLERNRLVVLAGAAVLTGTAVAAVGVVGFVGLVAPHVARALVGGRHRAVLPLAAAIGAVVVGVADAVGRTVIAPAQVPAGLVTALVGTPYFVWLLWRSRRL